MAIYGDGQQLHTSGTVPPTFSSNRVMLWGFSCSFAFFCNVVMTYRIAWSFFCECFTVCIGTYIKVSTHTAGKADLFWLCVFALRPGLVLCLCSASSAGIKRKQDMLTLGCEQVTRASKQSKTRLQRSDHPAVLVRKQMEQLLQQWLKSSQAG